jgi:hypothetical protein
LPLRLQFGASGIKFVFYIEMAERTPIQSRPKLSKRAFWDTDLAALDFDRHANFIITRIFERGRQEDQEAILAFYGERMISDILRSAPSLLPIARERAKRNFHLSDQDFACYRSTQPARNLSRY